MEDIFDKLQAVTGISKYSNSEVITPKPVVSDIVVKIGGRATAARSFSPALTA